MTDISSSNCNKRVQSHSFFAYSNILSQLMFLRAETIGWLYDSQCILCLQSTIETINWQQILKDNNRPTYCPWMKVATVREDKAGIAHRATDLECSQRWYGCVHVLVYNYLAKCGVNEAHQWSVSARHLRHWHPHSLTQSLWWSSMTLMDEALSDVTEKTGNAPNKA